MILTIHNPLHPGEVLREWLTGITVTEAAKRLGISRNSLSRLLNAANGVSADMDVRLSKALVITPGYWLGLQTDYDLWQARRHFKRRVRPIVEAVA